MQRAVPFNKPFIAGKELAYVAEAVTLGNISGDGHFTQRCSQLLEEQFGIKRVLLTPSCTAALEMAVLLAGVGPGDEVILCQGRTCGLLCALRLSRIRCSWRPRGVARSTRRRNCTNS